MFSLQLFAISENRPHMVSIWVFPLYSNYTQGMSWIKTTTLALLRCCCLAWFHLLVCMWLPSLIYQEPQKHKTKINKNILNVALPIYRVLCYVNTFIYLHVDFFMELSTATVFTIQNYFHFPSMLVTSDTFIIQCLVTFPSAWISQNG